MEVDGGGGGLVMAGHKPALILTLLTALEFLESLWLVVDELTRLSASSLPCFSSFILGTYDYN